MLSEQSGGEPVPRDAEPGMWSRVMHRIAYVDTPKRTAAAFALGVFLSFSPFLGFQTAIGLSTAVLLRLSKVAVFAGLCTNLPWIMVPWYALTTAAAAAVFRSTIDADLSDALTRVLAVPVYRAAFWTQAADVLAPFFWSFVLGSTMGAAIVAAVAYVISARVISRIQKGHR